MSVHVLVLDLIWAATIISLRLILTCFKVVKVVSVLAVRMQVGAGQSRASSSPLGSFLQGKALACWEHTWAVHARAEIPTALTPPPTSHPSCSVLALWRVNWADLWDRRGGHRRAVFPLEPPDQHAQIRGNLFHNIVASCFPRLGPHRRQRQRFGRWPSLFVGLLVRTTCAELDSPLILLAL